MTGGGHVMDRGHIMSPSSWDLLLPMRVIMYIGMNLRCLMQQIRDSSQIRPSTVDTKVVLYRRSQIVEEYNIVGYSLYIFHRNAGRCQNIFGLKIRNIKHTNCILQGLNWIGITFHFQPFGIPMQIKSCRM